MLHKATASIREEMYFAVSPLMIFPQTLGKFRVFIRQAGNFVLYAAENEQFTPRHRQKLHDAGVTEVYIRGEQRPDFNRYIEKHLPNILADNGIPVEERCKVLYNASEAVVREVFETRLPKGIGKKEYARVVALVEKSIKFLAMDESLKRIAALAAHDYSVHTHNVQVFVYTTALLQSMKADDYTQVQAGIGALLHDIGKTRIPNEILSKPGPLTPEERQVINTHPAKGLALCQEVPLSQTACHCILMHHERMDGGGYPGGLAGELIPPYVRALTVADVYDALTTKRPYADAMQPFQALRLMRDEMIDAFDADVYKRLVMILSGANMV
ncbi:HD-GYP domain-containing protein [Solidesulfovibrio sp.]|jgi:HD-GYP domain-containing protein (c-di-GMP phosphodiesterase class II)|uniref:HD-GYP domain-containing protein n=1 Tax=Solidesulfovibrio sp. TaxID=2910990 RepID=UPI000EC490C9|nr:HD domain-containing phosphohydrolase [Solidesulfovibrio sp.]MEA5090038.1 HD domain-containing phosphohydrolase [Solidesulfovibrio sp.]HCR11923.1 HD family phosphohydrolase [Desulfovibrio sp.]HML60532.1 HD domain-containing phosphohydrolase [Solidesulfovibrio sp.]